MNTLFSFFRLFADTARKLSPRPRWLSFVIVSGIMLFAYDSSLLAQTPCVPTTTIGTLQYIAEFPSQRIQSRAVSIWLPPNYSPKQRYPVLYMHDGQNVFDSTCAFGHVAWEVDSTIADLTHKKKMRPCIVVGIHNTSARFTEYMPAKPFYATTQVQQRELLSHRNFSGQVIRSDEYLAWIVKELKPHIDSAFSTLPDRKNTFIAGSSMGGLISLYALCEYPKVFGGAGCLSTHWSVSLNDSTPAFPKAIQQYMRAHLPPAHTRHQLYFDYGTATLDRFYPKYQATADTILRARGYSRQQWTTKAFPGAEHNERAWKARLAEPLIFLLGTKKR